MNFVIDYEVCAILFLTVTACAFFSKRFLPTPQNKYYGWLLIAGLFFLSLDVVSCLLDASSERYPAWFLYAINVLLLAVTQLYTAMVYVYFVIVIYNKPLFFQKWRYLLLAPITISILIILSSPLTGWIFYLDESNAYWHGSLHLELYFVSTFYLVATGIAIWRAHKYITRNVRLTMICFLSLSVLATLLQLMFPRYMLSGVGLALALNIMLHVLQSPDLYIEKMTGLYNRNAVPVLFECQLRRKESFSIVIYIMDGMSNITNIFGMFGGEDVLGIIAKEIQHAYTKRDIFRYGPDSIGVFVPDVRITDDNVDLYAAKFPSLIEYQGHEVRTHCRTLALSGHDFSSVDSAIFALEQGIEILERDGFAGSIFVCDRETDASYRALRNAETLLGERIAEKNIDVRFFPVNATDGRLDAAEANVSMPDEQGGTIDMQTMYSLATRHGQVIPLNALLLERVCMFLKHYDIRRWGAKHVYVPLTPQACMETNLAASIQRILSRYRTDPTLVCFTVTETSAVQAANNLEINMRQLVAAGSSFLLDAYGTGYANLALLSRLPFRYVNMEPGFVELAWKQPGGRDFIANLIQLFESMELSVMCAVPDSETHLDELREMGFSYIRTFNNVSGLTELEFRDCLADSASAMWGK